MIKIQPANREHVENILYILLPYIKAGKLLPRDENDILDNLYSNKLNHLNKSSSPNSSSIEKKLEKPNSNVIHNFFIASYKNEYVGCVAIRDYGKGLFEIRSLAVSETAFGKGVGSALILAIIEAVKSERGGKRVFALTRRPTVFNRIGFRIVPMEMFPKKIWFDCSKCKKLDECDEVAVLYDL